MPQQPVFSRVVVLDVVYDPHFVTSERLFYWQNEFGLQDSRIQDVSVLPRNTIIGKSIINPNNPETEVASFFYPFFPPHLSLPCSPGEHVWVMMSEDSKTTKYGYWFCRITELFHVDDLNHTHPPRAAEPSFFSREGKKYFEFNNGMVSVDPKGIRRIIPGTEYISGGEDAYAKLLSKDVDQINASRLIPPAAVPRFKKRPGDLVLEGKNNSLIVLGTDRNGIVAEHNEVPYKNGDKEVQVPSPYIPLIDTLYGSIDMVVGRGQTIFTSGETAYGNLKPAIEGFPNPNKFPHVEQNKSPSTSIKYPYEGDPDLVNDVSRIRLSQKTKIDQNLELTNFNIQNFEISDSPDGDGAIVIKSDKLRLVARKDLEILVSNNDSLNEGSYAAIVIKSNGDIVFKPSDTGYVKLGGDDANKALLCTDYIATQNNGSVTATGPLGAVIVTTDGASFGSGAPNQGTIASKILVK